MRADAHYVEQLEATMPAVTVQYLAAHAIDADDVRAAEPSASLIDSIKRHGILEPLIIQRHNNTYRTLSGHRRLAAARAAGLREVPCLVHHVADDHARALREALNATRAGGPSPDPAVVPIYDTELGQSLTTLASCVGLLATASPLTRTVAVDLMQAEVRRAGCLLQAARVLRHGVTPGNAHVSPRDLLRRVMEAIEPERRLRGVAIDTAFELAAEGDVRGDQELLAGIVTLVVLTTMALLDGRSGARLEISATVEDRARLAIAVSQDQATIDDPSELPTGMPGSLAPASLAILAARRAAQAHDGRVLVVRAGAGTRVWMELPLDAARA